MARETTIKLEFELEDPAASADLTLTGAGITKSASAGTQAAPVGTEILLDPASLPAIPPGAGDWVLVDGTGWRSLDGKLHLVTAYDGVAGTITIATNTFAETDPLAPLVDISVSIPGWQHVCLSEFSSNPGSPGEVDATTMCDTERVMLPGLPSPGTASFTGMFDLDDKGMLALESAFEDGLPRWMIAKTRRGQMAVFHGTVSAFQMGSLGVEQAVTFTGSFTLDRKPSYARV